MLSHVDIVVWIVKDVTEHPAVQFSWFRDSYCYYCNFDLELPCSCRFEYPAYRALGTGYAAQGKGLKLISTLSWVTAYSYGAIDSFWKISVSTIIIDKIWSLVLAGLADVYRFKCCIQECVHPPIHHPHSLKWLETRTSCSCWGWQDNNSRDHHSSSQSVQW